MSPAYDYDVVVIGSGSGGLAAAKTAVQYGAKTAIIERLDRLGGDCTWFGCVPSKALIRCSRAVAEAKASARFGVEGIDPGAVRCDWPKVQAHVKACQNHIYKQDDSPEVLGREGITVITGHTAAFVDPHTLRLTRAADAPEAGVPTTVTGDRFILSTGAGPNLPPIAGLEEVPYLTYETVFSMEKFPASLCVVGGGPIGSELAQAFARLGSKVTQVGTLLPREDDHVREVMREVFREDGIESVEGRASKARREGDGIVLEVSGGAQVRTDALLVASGRKPKGLETLDLDKAGVRWSQKGIVADSKLRTSCPHIFAVGDCLGGLQFTHLAGYQGAFAAFNAVLPVSVTGPKPEQCPRCTFTHPEVASVGLSEQEAREKLGENLCIAMKRMDHVDRAICEGETRGFIRILHTKKGKMLGATVVAPVAGEVASELGVAIEAGVTIGQAATMHSYPSYSFALQQIFGEIYSKQLNTSAKLSCLRRCCGRRLRGKAMD
eukprot:CAMPEP_0168379186 /NCGR_PEP_ID=MMETSP0228-20121227/11715_1 /TAXON_ID=133427 /ORGANISM="Protoceratium reticulatum, Strain CCCM 535 (=CCMP 1889)" /LENGTH=493 /DNA_ID=CAMNT_0008392213 /DNA_START=47 /DNA_END=1528 /DNA_ORIENTATION=-